ncbi:MAG: hypothetical protein K5905_18695 [Roseibium sp.]|uniref:hypothetical protein n=1 Tax=Roseibium sp. TaxID=1936156 RepID=UPI002613D03E|nr:hypothetical protein [Roseibium sp.]MCV0427491.1 hypothetical protein [Roseibium sp.]
MQISVETTSQSTSLFSASFSNHGSDGPKGKGHGHGHEIGQRNGHHKAPALSVLDAASEKAEKDAVVIAALQAAVEKGKSGKSDDEDKDGALATVEDYQKTAGKLKAALGEEDTGGPSASVAYESATISTTTIEAEIGGETISAQFVSYERVSFNSETGLSVRSASASTIEGDFDNGSFSYQSASVSELYAGTGEQVSNLASLIA